MIDENAKGPAKQPTNAPSTRSAPGRRALRTPMSSNPPLPYHIPFLRPASDGPRTPFPLRSLSTLSNRRLEHARAHAHASCRIASEGASRVSIASPFFMARARARKREREREKERERKRGTSDSAMRTARDDGTKTATETERLMRARWRMKYQREEE